MKHGSNSRSRSIRALLCLLSCYFHGAVVADRPSFRGLGDLPGGVFSSIAEAISNDGSTVVGSSASDRSGWIGESMYWTTQTGMVGLGNFAGERSYESEAYGVSSDGSVIVGLGTVSSHGEAYRWTADEGMISLGDLPGGTLYSAAAGVSGNGEVIVGESASKRSSPFTEAFLWTARGGMVPLLDDFDRNLNPRVALDANEDGSVIVGKAATIKGFRAFRWNREEGMVLLQELCEQCRSMATAVSSDGRVIVGTTIVELRDGVEYHQPFRWTAEDGLVPLGDLPDEYDSTIQGLAVSNDGNVIVGRAIGYGAIIWRPQQGLVLLADVLKEEHGIDVSDWSLTDAVGVSGDGCTIAGFGTNPDGNGEAFIAHLGSFDTGDANCDYEVDFKDIDAFVLALTDPAEYDETYDCDIKLADINRDGSVDFNDIDGFVECLVNGGCE